MNQVQIPTNRLPTPTLQGAPIGPDGMQRVFEEVMRRHLYSGPVPLEELLLLDDPPEAQRHSRARARVADTPTEYDKCPRYEMRYTENLYVAEQGVVGHTTEEQFKWNVEWMWQKEWEQVGGPAGEQPGGDWQMAACAIRQVDCSVTIPVRGNAPDMAAMIRSFDGGEGWSPASIRQAGGGGIAGYRNASATRWVCPMVFVDVSRSELRDPAKVWGTRDNPTSALTEYILSRQLRHMVPSLRANRKKGTDLIEEFIATRGQLETERLVRETQKLSREQLQRALELLGPKFGVPEAIVAGMLDVSVETLRRALDGAVVPTAK